MSGDNSPTGHAFARWVETYPGETPLLFLRNSAGDGDVFHGEKRIMFLTASACRQRDDALEEGQSMDEYWQEALEANRDRMITFYNSGTGN